MPTRDKYELGSFSWVELATTNGDAAKKFYGDLFGWKFTDNPMGPDMVYTMCEIGGKPVCALYKMGADMKGMPPNWASYITVDNVDDVAKKVTANNGKLMKEPFDVMTFGRMAVAQDPTGAVVCFWQAKDHIGAHVRDDQGTLCWNELFTTNVDAAGKFYTNVVGWKAKAMDMGPMGTYTLFHLGDEKKNVGGMLAVPPNMKGVPSHWLAYFATNDVDGFTKKVTALGGKQIAPPTDIPNIGRFSIVQDPQGATFALYKNAH
jgi:predicted enzyme related to lactoylglutathione lyase